MIGKRVGKWTVVGAGANRGYRKTYFCRCDCGTEKEVYAQNLRGKSTSCGCQSKINKKGHEHILGTYWGRLRLDAVRRGISFDVSIEHAWSLYGGVCALSGLPIGFARSARELWNGENTASLDRIDSESGYVQGNIQWVHKDVNKIKQNFSEMYFINLCGRIYEHAKKPVKSRIDAVSPAV